MNVRVFIFLNFAFDRRPTKLEDPQSSTLKNPIPQRLKYYESSKSIRCGSWGSPISKLSLFTFFFFLL